MTETTADNRSQPPTPEDIAPENTASEDAAPENVDSERIDPLDRIASELDGLAELDPAEAVTVLANVTAELNKELDADTDRS